MAKIANLTISGRCVATKITRHHCGLIFPMPFESVPFRSNHLVPSEPVSARRLDCGDIARQSMSLETNVLHFSLFMRIVIECARDGHTRRATGNQQTIE